MDQEFTFSPALNIMVSCNDSAKKLFVVSSLDMLDDAVNQFRGWIEQELLDINGKKSV